MRIACPECSAAYDVPAERVPPGKGVRCARCGGVWTPVALEDAVPPLVVREPAVVVEPAVERASVVERAAVTEVVPVPVPVPAVVPAEPERALVVERPLAVERAEVAAVPATEPVRDLPGDAAEQPPVAAEAPVVAAAGPAVRPGVPVWVGWVLTGVVLAGLGGAAVAWRGEVMRAWPASERVYRAVGLR